MKKFTELREEIKNNIAETPFNENDDGVTVTEESPWEIAKERVSSFAKKGLETLLRKPETSNKSVAPSPTKSQSEKPVLMGKSQLARYKTSNADTAKKFGVNNSTTVAPTPGKNQTIMGPTQAQRYQEKNPTTSGQSAKPAVQKSVPKAAPPKPQTNNTMGMSSAAYNDLRASAAKMKSATSDMASKTGAMKSSLQKIAPSGRMERPISPGGQTSSQVHQSISRLGGEPTRPSAPKAVPKAAPAAPAKVSGGAPTTAVGSKPPPLSSKNASGGKWM